MQLPLHLELVLHVLGPMYPLQEAAHMLEPAPVDMPLARDQMPILLC
jgi:hypothetical protein